MDYTDRSLPGNHPLDVSAIVVNFNSGEILSACVSALASAGASEVIVVDNSSNDGSLEFCENQLGRELTSKLMFLRNKANLGYGTAMNIGVRSAKSKYIAICNPDCIPAPDALQYLVAYLQNHPEVGIVGPQIYDEKGVRYPSPRRFPSLFVSAIHATWGVLFPKNKFSKYYRSVDSEFPNRNMWISGAFMFITRDLFHEIGGFDERYFMFLEDVDLCQRVIRKSLDVGFEPKATVEHRQGTSSRARPFFVCWVHHRSLWIYSTVTLLGVKRFFLPLVGLGILVRFGLSTLQITIKKALSRVSSN